ncbi:hypothetical protein LEP1GSC166_3880 [Leptospira kirschneri]|nr:hypothetical protein LEP1GSC198_0647 [Leptospira kirschneri str. JB]EMK05724.1 hypothetical protein LEP1GSC166_3880 [Leptospira kirschneri]
MKIVGTTIKYKRIIVQSDFLHKIAVLQYHQNLNPILAKIRLRKNFLKV